MKEDKIKVRSTGASINLGYVINELGRTSWEGEEFEVTPYRFAILSGQNKYRVKFVTKVNEPEPVEHDYYSQEENNDVDQEEEVYQEPDEEEKPSKKRRKNTVE